MQSQPYLDYLSSILKICLPIKFSRGSWQRRSASTYMMSKKKLGSFKDCINANFQSFICLPWYEHFLASIFCKVLCVPWRCWTEFSQSWKGLRKTLPSHENLRSLTDLNGANIGFRSNSRDWLFWMFVMWKINTLMNKSVLFW